MIKGKSASLQGILLDGSEPIHPFLLEYLNRQGVIVTQEDGYVTISGDYELPDIIQLLGELKALSRELYNDVVYDLEITEDEFGGVEYKVIEKQPRTEPTREEYNLITQVCIHYFKLKGADVMFDTDPEFRICVIGGDFPENETDFGQEFGDFLVGTLDNFVDFTYFGDVKVPHIHFYDDFEMPPKEQQAPRPALSH